ncbi:MAG TPA: phosphoribosylglycinamide formyltransferase [Holophaga sp.]|nr:phosphoribosylglycinamide formyltransferase [Holophaga sp.]
MKRIAFFISGTGGNALNLLRACRDGCVPADPALAISSSSKALGVERLRSERLPVDIILRSAFDDDEAFSTACFASVEAAKIDVICLCGWLKRLVIPSSWEGRILNIHPSLLPQFGGSGMYGMHVHRAVLDAGESISGCTVHLVDNQFDHGRILAQAQVPVMPDDSPEGLQKRIYEQEMRLYPQALADYLVQA